MEDYEYYHTDPYDPTEEIDEKHTKNDANPRNARTTKKPAKNVTPSTKKGNDKRTTNEYLAINEWGPYAPTADELYDRIGDILALSYGEKAAWTICRAWSKKAAARPGSQLDIFR